MNHTVPPTEHARSGYGGENPYQCDTPMRGKSMNGNNPYAGRPGTTSAGQRNPADELELTADQRRMLQDHLSAIAAHTRELLPGEYAVAAELRRGATGPEATVAVRPPVGHAVSAGFAPEEADLDADELPLDDVAEVAHGLAATAALQVKQAMGEADDLAAR